MGETYRVQKVEALATTTAFTLTAIPTVRHAELRDLSRWSTMRQLLWPDEPVVNEAAAWFTPERTPHLEAVLLAVDDRDIPIGFAEMNIRAYAEGCYSGRVAFLEGWFVEESLRGHGVGRALMLAAEAWGREMNCTEFGSDTQVFNEESVKAHKALGFEEVERIVCFRKDL
jgi:aminoglycoside 6'-N-acetyltransferase I